MDTAYGPETLYCAECGRPSSPDELARFGDLLICADCKTRYAQKLREGVETAPAVRYGGFWIRVGASLIDGVILFTINTILNFALRGVLIPVAPQPRVGATLTEIWAAASVGMIRATLINTLINGIYEVAFLSQMGATPGKAAFGLKVVRPDGRPIGVGRAIGRFFAKLGEGWIILIGWCGYILAGIDSQKRALHDMICDTRVIKTR